MRLACAPRSAPRCAAPSAMRTHRSAVPPRVPATATTGSMSARVTTPPSMRFATKAPSALQPRRFVRAFSTESSAGPVGGGEPNPRIKEYKNGDRYEGDLKDGQPHGQGTFKGADGASYTGNFKDGKPDGFGVMSYPNGEEYRGEFQAGERNGRGLYRYSSGDSYDGEWRAGQRHGDGTYTSADGSTYVGQWSSDRKHGKGVMTLAAEDSKVPHNGRYDGEWRHGHRHGQGTYLYANGDRYVGLWERGQQHGKGTLFGHDGSKRDSAWRNGAQHGTGVYINAEGQAFRATWENGKGYIEAPLAPEPPKAAPAAKAAAKSAVATGSAEAPKPAAAPSKASITLEQVSAGLEAPVTEPKEPFVDVPEDVYDEVKRMQELSKDPRVQAALSDEELKANLRKWAKGLLRAEELSSHPKMQEVRLLLEEEARRQAQSGSPPGAKAGAPRASSLKAQAKGKKM